MSRARKPGGSDQADIDAQINRLKAIETDRQREQIPAESIEIKRRSRSKRGLTRFEQDISHVCFRTRMSIHKAIKQHCFTNNLEVGEYIESLIIRDLNLKS